MSFAAEPYGTFVEDLLANLTGGVSRLPFRYVEEELPFRLEEPRVRVASVRAHGLVDQEFTEFVRGRDFRTTSEGHVEWAAPGQEFNPPGAVLPDPGTVVWVGFDKLPGDTRPLLNDRNPGSVLRTLAESFAREFAVLSQQLDLVYDAAFVETATGRDLDQVAALVGVSRRGATHARGEVVLRRPTPAPADITVPAGTLVSTARPPQITVETTEAVTLRRGSFSVAAPVRAQQPGPDGVAAERTLTVIHRAIFGIEEVLNPAGLAFRGGAEPDDELRSRVSRALESSGRSTVGAIRGALASLEGIREQDVLVQEDHLTSPGLVRVKVAAAITEETAILASRLLEDHRPAGIRIEHNLPAPTTPIPTTSQDTGGGGDGPPDTPAPALDDVFAPLLARVVVTPADVQLNETQKTRLAEVVEAALVGAIDEIGAGEPVVYNRLVSAVMAVHGVLDAVLEIGVPTTPEQKPLRRYNLRPEQGRRPQARTRRPVRRDPRGPGGARRDGHGRARRAHRRPGDDGSTDCDQGGHRATAGAVLPRRPGQARPVRADGCPALERPVHRRAGALRHRAHGRGPPRPQEGRRADPRLGSDRVGPLGEGQWAGDDDMSARALAVLDRFPLHLATTDPEKRFEHVVGGLVDPVEVLTRQVGEVRRSHRLSEAPTLADLLALGGIHGLHERMWAIIAARLAALAEAAQADPVDLELLADHLGLTESQLTAIEATALPGLLRGPGRHRESLGLRRGVVVGVIGAHVIGNATAAALLNAAAAYVGFRVDEITPTEERWWHLATCSEQIRIAVAGADPEPDLLALEENPFHKADLDPAPKKHAQLFQVIRGGLQDVDVTVRVIGTGQRTVRPMVVETFAGRGLAYEGGVPDGSELRFEASGRATLDGTDVTGSTWSFTGGVFASSSATRPHRDFVFADAARVADPGAGRERWATFVTTAPLTDALGPTAGFPHGAARVGPLQLPLGESRWVAFARVAHTSTAVPGVDAPRHKHARFDDTVFAEDDTLEGTSAGTASMEIGFEWEEREPFAVRVLLPHRLQRADDESGSRIREPLRRLLDRHRAAGVDVRVEYADPRWTLGTGVVRNETDEALGTVLAGTELWPDGTPQPGPR